MSCVTEDPSPYTLEAATADAALGKDSQGVLYCYCKLQLFALMDVKQDSWTELGK